MQHFGGGGGFHLSSSAVSARLTIGVKYFKILNMIFEYNTASPPLPASDDLNNKMECSSAAEVFISLLQKRLPAHNLNFSTYSNVKDKQKTQNVFLEGVL